MASLVVLANCQYQPQDDMTNGNNTIVLRALMTVSAKIEIAVLYYVLYELVYLLRYSEKSTFPYFEIALLDKSILSVMSRKYKSISFSL